jgi:hypothetical protein
MAEIVFAVVLAAKFVAVYCFDLFPFLEVCMLVLIDYLAHRSLPPSSLAFETPSNGGFGVFGGTPPP